MIKALIFDFSGVIATWGYWLWLAENVPNFENTKNYYIKISYKVDSGEMSENQFISILAEKSGKEKERIWPEIFQTISINQKMLGLIKNLKLRYKVGLLTNFVNEWMLEILEVYKLHHYFDSMIISSQVNLIKPDPRIYYKMLQSLGVQTQEAIFIDDNKINVDGAIKIGINGMLFQDYDQLRGKLQKYSVF